MLPTSRVTYPTYQTALSTAKRVQIVAALVEGCGIRATACIRMQDETLRGLPCKRLQVA